MSSRLRARIYNDDRVVQWVTGSSVQDIVNKAVAASKGYPRGGIQNDITLIDYMAQWNDLYQRHIRHTTRSAQDSLIRKHILPEFGSWFIHTITVNSIQSFLNDKAELGLSKKTIKEIRSTLRKVLQSAYEDGIIQSNPAASRRIINNGVETSGRNALTEEQLSDILQGIPYLKRDDDRLYISLLAYLGVRPEEARGLRFNDIDIPRRRISIRRTVTFLNNQPVIGATKTKASVRDAVMPERLADILSTISGRGFLFSGDAPKTEHYYRAMWKRIASQINLHGATPYSFRHTYATHGRRAGISQKAMQALGGWCDPDVLNSVYIHIQDTDLDIAKKQLDKMFEDLSREELLVTAV